MKFGVRLVAAAVVVGGVVLSTARGGTVSGPFDLVRGWSGGPWDYQYPWAGQGYPCFGFGAPYTWDRPLGFGKAGPYIWGAPFASPSLYLPEAPAETPQAETGAEPQSPVPTVAPIPSDEPREASDPR